MRDVVTLYQKHSLAEGVHGAAALKERAFVFGLFLAECGDLPVSALKPYVLSDFIAGHPEWKSTATRRQKANVVKAAFNWAATQERIDRNPFRSIRYAEADRRPEMPDAILERLYAVLQKPQERMIRFLRLTGCRVAEACNATWADVDLDRGAWVIHKHKSRKRTRKPKVVALVGEAVSLLRGLIPGAATVPAVAGLEAVSVSAVSAVDARRIGGPIFLNARGKPWTQNAIWFALERAKKRLGIETQASIHSIRHTFATEAVKNGAPLTLVAAQLGHASPTVTARYYLNLDDQMDAIRAAAEKGAPRGQ